MLCSYLLLWITMVVIDVNIWELLLSCWAELRFSCTLHCTALDYAHNISMNSTREVHSYNVRGGGGHWETSIFEGALNVDCWDYRNKVLNVALQPFGEFWRKLNCWITIVDVAERKSKSTLNKVLVDLNMMKVLSPTPSKYVPGSHSTLINSHCLFNLGHITRDGYLAATKKLTNTETVHNPGLFP